MTTVDSPRRSAEKFAVAAAAALGMTLAVTACGSGGDSHAGADGADTAAASPDTTASSPAPDDEAGCGGRTVDHEAAITSSTEILIDAPLDRVWDLHTDVEGWEAWQDAVLTIERLDSGPLASDSRFEWTTPVPESEFAPADTLTITSSLQEMEPGACVLWEGPAVGESITSEQGVHLWNFTEADGGTLVYTEESWDAELLDSLPEADVDPVAEMLGGGLEIWLQELKTEAESAA